MRIRVSVRRSGARTTIAVLVVFMLSLGYVWATRAKDERVTASRAHPALFPASYSCESGPNAHARAQRLERYAKLYVERYPYDPADGVRGVLYLGRAASCYARAGNEGDAIRAKARSLSLSSRIDTDYASARVALEKTLASGNWSSALPEAYRLLRLTQHLHKSPYIAWLEATFGKVAARAGEIP